MDSCFLTALLPSTLDSIEILFHVDNECYLSDVSPAYIIRSGGGGGGSGM